jgi:hypothetical protein
MSRRPTKDHDVGAGMPVPHEIDRVQDGAVHLTVTDKELLKEAEG